MGYEPMDAEIEAYQDRLYQDFYDEYKNSDHYWEDRNNALEEYLAKEILPERLETFYLRKSDITQASLDLLIEARELYQSERYSASQVFAGASLEVTFKDVLLKPVVFGLIHNDIMAEMIVNIFSKHIREIDKFSHLLIQIIKEISGIDISIHKMEKAKQTVWEQATKVRDQRNLLLHTAKPATQEEAEMSLSVATFVLESLFPEILKNLGLYLNADNKICAPRRGITINLNINKSKESSSS